MNIPVMGAWVPVEYRPDDIIVHAPQPLLLEGRRDRATSCPTSTSCTTAVDLGRPRRAGGGRHRRLLQPRAAGKLRRVAEAAAPRRTRRRGWPSGRGSSATLCSRTSRAMAGASPTSAARRSASSTATSISARRVTMALDRQRLGESLVKGPFTAIYPGGLCRRHELLRRGNRPSTIRIGSTAPRRCSRRRA